MLYSNINGVKLRKLAISDLSLLLEYKKESWASTHRISLLNDTDQDNWFKRVNTNPNTLVLIAERDTLIEKVWKDHLAVGFYFLDNIDWPNRSYSMSYGLFKYARGQGIGSLLLEAGIDFAFEILNLRRMECEILETNLPSLRCAEKVGLVKEGTKRAAVFRCNKEINSLMFSILRSDWPRGVC